MFEAEQQAVEAAIRQYCQQAGLPAPQSLQWKPLPFSGEWGISTSLFQLAADEARQQPPGGERPNVNARAALLAEQIAAHLGTPPGFARVEAARGYLNLYFRPGEYLRRVVDAVLEQGERFGAGAPSGQRLMVEFSQPNTHKAFHVGHLRSAILGDTLARILEFAGHTVIRANYPGDMGLHVIIWLWNYLKHHPGERPTADVTRWMGDLYAEARKRLDENPALEPEVRALYARWDRREPEIVALWEQTRQWSLDGFHELYDTLDIRFDRYYFNSEMEQPGKAVVDELIRKGIALDERPAGPVIVKLDELLGNTKEKYRVLVVLRSDNTALYSTEDLALAGRKFADYNLDRSLYVVDVRQSLHFQQVFKTLEIAGYPWATRCEHVPYELVNLPGNVVIASREGNVVLLEELIREAILRALQVVEAKNPDLSQAQKEEVARAVGLGAIKYPMLARENAKLVTFDWQTALDFNGQAAPSIQYSRVRANSILRKALAEQGRPAEPLSAAVPPPLTPGHTLEPSEVQLVDLISRLPGEVQRAAAELKPLLVANLAYDLSKAFNDFYAACPVLRADPPVRASRLRLIAAARQALGNLLGLLGIRAPEVM